MVIFRAAMDHTSGASVLLSFKAIIEIEGINPYVRVSAARARRLCEGWRKPMPVLVRIDGAPAEPWRIHMMPKGEGRFFLYLHERVRKASGTGVGDRVTVEIGFDGKHRPGPAPLPPWLRQALQAHPAALAGYRALTPGRKKELVKNLIRLKSPEARARNLDMALRVLSGERARFMARDWNGGR